MFIASAPGVMFHPIFAPTPATSKTKQKIPFDIEQKKHKNSQRTSLVSVCDKFKIFIFEAKRNLALEILEIYAVMVGTF